MEEAWVPESAAAGEEEAAVLLWAAMSESADMLAPAWAFLLAGSVAATALAPEYPQE